MFPDAVVHVRRLLSPLAAIGLLLAWTLIARAAEETRVPFHLPAGNAKDTLPSFAAQARCELMFPTEPVGGVRTHAVDGWLTPRAALDRMLADTGLMAVADPATGALMVVPRAPPSQPSPTSPPSRMTSKHFARLLGAWLALAGSGVAADSAATGTITGQISNNSTATFLEGADVVLQPGDRLAHTGRDGRYAFTNLAPGNYRLDVSYTGLERKTIPVVLESGQHLVRDVELTSEIYTLGAFTVAGDREGNAQAITLQRNAPNITNVLSSDAFGNVADQNIGNFLQRMPGISAKGDEGEIYQIQVRGINADMNSITIDGTRAANGTNRSGLNRAVEVDKIPADFIDRIEVTKAITPDMDADSIGGSINLKTKSALDRKGRFISYSVGSSYNTDRKTFRPLGSFMFSDVLGKEQRLGVLFTTSYSENHKPRESVQLQWEQTPDTDRPVWYYIDSVGDDELEHTRGGAGLRLDYKLSDTTRIFGNYLYSYYQDALDRHWVRMRSVSASRIRPGYTDRVTETFNHSFLTNRNIRDRDTVTHNLQLGGETNGERALIDYSVNYSTSEGNNRRKITSHNVAGVGFREDATRSLKFPEFEQTSGPDILDLDNATMPEVTRIGDIARDRIWGGQVNYKRLLATARPSSIKVGARYRAQRRLIDRNEDRYSYVGPDGVAGLNKATGVNDDDLARFIDHGYNRRLVKGRYPSFPFTDPNLVFQELETHPELFLEDVAATVEEHLSKDAEAAEDVYAGYVMGDIQLGRLTLTGGVRMEETHVSGVGVVEEVTPEEAARRASWTGPLTPEEIRRRAEAEFGNRRRLAASYRDFFPSLHAKFDLTSHLVARLSYSTGIGRPNFGDIVPNTTVDNGDLTVETNNIDLKPEYARSYDASLEYYFEPAGLVSVGVFDKEIRDFIYSASAGLIGAGSANGFNGQYEGYELTSNFNGGHAQVRGIELAYQQQLSFLPGFWRGFGVFANYTYLKTSGDYGNIGSSVTSAELEDFTPRTGNVGLSYTGYGWTMRLKYNYTAGRLASFNARPERRLYWRSYDQTDFSVQYDFNRHLGVFADVINVFNTPTQDQYYYVTSRAKRSEEFATTIKFGISGQF